MTASCSTRRSSSAVEAAATKARVEAAALEGKNRIIAGYGTNWENIRSDVKEQILALHNKKDSLYLSNTEAVAAERELNTLLREHKIPHQIYNPNERK